MIREVIVVEGKDDIDAVKKAVDAELICTSGLGINAKTIERIKSAQERCGVIILTDPDYAGERIRKIISKKVPGCRHAFLPRDLATKKGDIGVENASPEAIRDALSKVKTEINTDSQEFTDIDLMRCGLNGKPGATAKRDMVGRILGIGYGNAKQFLNRLNRYGVTREEFNEAVIKSEGV